MAETLWVCNAGTLEYHAALALQEALRIARQRHQIPDTLLLLEHSPAVYTRGRRSAPGELTMGEAWYAQQGIEIIETKRGGKVTYHGPGQLVGYGIVGVDDVVGYVRLLEAAIVEALRSEAIQSRGRPDDGPDYTGVWIEDRKIASIGVHVALGVTTHGFAVNVENDLRPFEWVVACGLPEVTMTSIAAEQDTSIPAGAGVAHEGTVAITAAEATGSERFLRFRAAAAAAFAQALDRAPTVVDLDQLQTIAAAQPSASPSGGPAAQLPATPSERPAAQSAASRSERPKARLAEPTGSVPSN